MQNKRQGCNISGSHKNKEQTLPPTASACRANREGLPLPRGAAQVEGQASVPGLHAHFEPVTSCVEISPLPDGDWSPASPTAGCASLCWSRLPGLTASAHPLPDLGRDCDLEMESRVSGAPLLPAELFWARAGGGGVGPGCTRG